MHQLVNKKTLILYHCLYSSLGHAKHHRPPEVTQPPIRKSDISPTVAAGGPRNSVGIANGWTDRRSNPGRGGEIFHTCPEWPWGPPSLLYNGYRVFPGSKERPGLDADPSLPSSAVVMRG